MSNSSSLHPMIAKEGWVIIASVAVAWLLSIWLLPGFLSMLILIGLVFCVQFFRDPMRNTPHDERAVFSPADGRVLAVESEYDPYAERNALKISVFMNVFNVHSNRMPMQGEVKQLHYFPGNFFNAALDKASEQNERQVVLLDNTSYGMITVVQVAGLIARRILCYLNLGDQVEAGQRFGFIRFGSRVDLYLPEHVKVLVFPGDKVSAGMTRLARFN